MSSADQVTSLYATILGRTPDPAGFSFWMQALDGGFPLQQVRDGFAYSPEATNDIEALAAAANTGLTGAGIAGYEDQLSGGSSFDQVRASFDDDHVVALYQDVLGRAPEAAGLGYWEGRLAEGASIQDVQNGIAYSQEATVRVQALAASQSIPLSRIDVVSYETQLAGGQSFSQMAADLDANNIIVEHSTSYHAFPDQYISAPLTDQTAPIGGSVQPFAALHLYEDPTGTSGTFEANVSLSSYGTEGGIAPAGTLLLSPAGGSVNQYGSFSVTGTRSQVESALQGLTVQLDSSGDGVTPSGSVYDGNIFPDGFYVNISAAAGTPAAGLNYIYGIPGNDLLLGSGASDLFLLGPGPSGFDTIVGFDPAHDVLQLSATAASSFTAVQASMSAVGPGAYIHLANGSSVLLYGVSPSSLSPENISIV